MDHPELAPEDMSIWEKPGTLRVIWIALIAGCIASAVGGFILAAQGLLVKKPHFDDKTGFVGMIGTFVDTFPVFYGLVGFVSFSFIVLAGQHLRKILMRDEDYYDSDATIVGGEGDQ